MKVKGLIVKFEKTTKIGPVYDIKFLKLLV